MNHGTRFSIASGCACDSCRLMRHVYEAQERRRSPRPRHRRECVTRVATSPLVDATAWTAIIVELVRLGNTQDDLAAYAGVGSRTIRDLAAGKRKLQERTVTKLLRLLELLPEVPR